MTHSYDIIIFGGGVAGLFVANRLKHDGYNVIVIEKDALGHGQTLASQGMIHGGQKYTLEGKVTPEAAAIAAMPARWDACLDGTGEIDLSHVESLSLTQIMFPAGNFFSGLTTLAAAKAVRGDTRRLKKNEYPDALTRGPVFEMQEKVLNTKSLITELAKPLQGRILKGTATELLPDGQVAVDGQKLQAQAILFTAGAGNEEALKLLKVKETHTQRRPLRQIMVRHMPDALYGHGITNKPKPRVTITSHSDHNGEYIWYLGGNIAELGASLTDAEALAFAKKEMQEMFPHINWDEKEWATWLGDRAEPKSADGRLPPGPVLHQRGKVLLAWPVKLTFAPLLADNILDWLKRSDIRPHDPTPPPALTPAETGHYPWEHATWQRI